MPAKGWKGYERNDELLAINKTMESIDSKAKGTIAESYICARLAELGFDVWQPYMGNHRADLAVWLETGRFVRIQARLAGFDPDRERFRALTTTRDKDGKHVLSKLGSFDFFVFKCEGIPAFYVVPASIGASHTSLNFYPHREKCWSRSLDCERYRDAFQLIKDFDGR